MKEYTTLATLVYYKGLEEKMKEKYLKRIEYLVGANNELIKELEQYEKVGMTEKVLKHHLESTFINNVRD